jgi:hypothetical protein
MDGSDSLLLAVPSVENLLPDQANSWLASVNGWMLSNLFVFMLNCCLSPQGVKDKVDCWPTIVNSVRSQVLLSNLSRNNIIERQFEPG